MQTTLVEKRQTLLEKLRSRQDRIWSILMLLPSMVAVAVFIYGFILWNGYVSLSKWNGVMPNYSWNGLQNYLSLFQTQRFQIDCVNMLVFSVVFIGGCTAVGLLLAILLDLNIKGECFFRGVFLCPMAIALVVTGVVWSWLLSPGNAATGYLGINQLFDRLDLKWLISGWYTDQRIGIIAVALAGIWQLSGYIMAIFLTAIRGIPYEIREAARIDGANEPQLYCHIILPNLSAVILGNMIVLGHMSLKVFDLVAAMTGPGRGFCTDVPAYYMWDTAFRGNNFNTGAAIGMILLIAISVLVIPYLVHLRRSEA
jgi:glucose/mannose transport system permease protein